MSEKQADYRPSPITGRLSPEQERWLDERRKPGEGRFPALKRRAGMPGTGGDDIHAIATQLATIATKHCPQDHHDWQRLLDLAGRL